MIIKHILKSGIGFVLTALLFTALLLGCESEQKGESAESVNKTSQAVLSNDKKTDKLFQSLGINRLSEITIPGDAELQDLNGKKVKLSDLKGKIVFLNFWATWCPECVVEMPAMEKLHKNLKDKDFVMIAVDLKESEKKVKTFMNKHKLTFPVLLDEKSKLANIFAVRAIPTTYILNREGKLIGRAMGSRKWGDRDSMKLFNYLIDN